MARPRKMYAWRKVAAVGVVALVVVLLGANYSAQSYLQSRVLPQRTASG